MSDLTKKALATSLKELLEEKSIRKITVGEICDRCGVRRQTFYYHFSDLPELVEWICCSEAEAAIQKNRNYATWEEGFYDVFLLAKKEKAFIMNIYHGVSRDTLERYLCNLTKPLLKHVVDEVASSLHIEDVTESDKDFVARFYTVAFVDVMIGWVDRSMQEDPKVIIGHLSPLVKGTISNALTAYSGRN